MATNAKQPNPDTSLSDNSSFFRKLLRAIKTLCGWVFGAKSWRGMAGMTTVHISVALSAVLVAIWVTPRRSIDALGQHFTLRAASLDWSWAGHGELTVNTGHPQTFFLLPSWYYGPLRAHLGVDAPFQGSSQLNQAAIEHKLPQEASAQFMHGFRAWLEMYLGIALGVGVLLAAFIALLMVLSGRSRRRAVWFMVRSVIVTAGCLALAAVLFATGSASIAQASSLDGLVGRVDAGLHLSPKPEGPERSGYDIVSIGDSRAATQGGKAPAKPSQDDRDCLRSSDSLAAQIGRIANWKTLNLACSGATINQGLLGEQKRGDRYVISQVGALKNMTDVRAVVVTIGPNDLWWSRAIGLCYYAQVCDDNLTTAQYKALLEKFKWNYSDLLEELDNLAIGPGGSRPKILINGSYDVFKQDETCEATKDFDASKLDVLIGRNGDLNDTLKQGADLYGFHFVKPQLKTFCESLSNVAGSEIFSPKHKDRFHPTSVGVATMAAQDVAALSVALAN